MPSLNMSALPSLRKQQLLSELFVILKSLQIMNRTNIGITALDSSRHAPKGYLLVSPREMQRSGLVYSLFGKVRDTQTSVRLGSRSVILTLRQ
jgi:hypothetical protein